MQKILAEARAVEAREFYILVVEDEVLIRILISDVLREEGFNVIEACSGEEAVDILAAGKHVDLIFSDVRMPGSIDGLGLLGFARTHFPELPVVLTSAHLAPNAAAAEGARCFVRKPYQFEAVLGIVAAELARGR